MAMNEERISGLSPPDGISVDEVPNLLPFQPNSRSESRVDEDLAYAEHDGSNCEIGFGNEFSEEMQIDTIKKSVFGVASNLMEVVVGMRKKQMEDDELSNNTSNILWDTSALEIDEDALINKADCLVQSYHSNDSVSIPPEIEMLHMEADLLLESIRFGISPECLSDATPKKNREGVEDILNRKQYNFDQLEDNDEIESVSSSFTDDDGMRGEIQNLGLAVSNLRHDLENFTVPLGYGDCESLSGMSEVSLLAARHCSLWEVWSRAFEEIALSIKTLRRLGRENAGNNLPDGDLDERSGIRDAVHDWSSTILWSATVILIGSYFRASLFTENRVNELESSDRLENLEWMFSKDLKND